MKPVIIYVNGKGDELTISKSKLEEHIKQAYESGFEDGQRSSKLQTITPYYYDQNLPHPKDLTTTPFDIRPHIYCNATADATELHNERPPKKIYE